MLGDTYTIVDMAVWGWARGMPIVLGEAAWAKFPNLKRLVDEINARPADSAPRNSRTSTSSRPKWTTRRAGRCSGI